MLYDNEPDVSINILGLDYTYNCKTLYSIKCFMFLLTKLYWVHTLNKAAHKCKQVLNK